MMYNNKKSRNSTGIDMTFNLSNVFIVNGIMPTYRKWLHDLANTFNNFIFAKAFRFLKNQKSFFV